MAKKFLTGLNLVVLDVDPTTGSEGELYFNSSASVAKIYQAGSWSVLGAGGGGTTVSTTEPDSPETGDSWYKNDTGEFYVYDGTYWVEVNGVISLTQEQVQDYVAPLFTHNNHVNASVHYEDELNQLHIEVTSAPTAGFTSTLKHDVRLNGSIAKGQAVYVSSANGTNMVVSKASNASEATSSKTLGLLETGGSNNSLVKVVTEGLLAGLDTSAANSEGDPVWLGTNGNLIYGLANKPYAPDHLVFIGVVTRKNNSNGEIFVKIQNGFELEEIHNVGIGYSASIQNNELLAYNSDSGLWINQTAEEAGLLTEESASTTYQLAGDYVTLDGSQTISGDKQFTNSTYFTSPITISNGASAGIGWSSLHYANDGYLIIQATDEPGPYPIPGTGSVKIDAKSDVIINSYAGGEYLGSIDPDNQIATVGILSEYLTEGSASSTYLTQVDASTTYITQIEANESFEPLNTKLSNISDLEMSSGFLVSNGIDDWYIDENEYLTTTNASSTFLSQEDAAVIYLAQSTAASAYQPVGEYLIGEDLNGYLTELSASATYQPIGDYLIPTDLEGYLTESSASITYQPLDEDLTQIALLSSASTGFLKTTGPGYWEIDTNTYLTTETDPVFSASDAAGITF
jgi:hypothetical protein